MNRITEGMIQKRIDYLNKVTDSPETSYTKTELGMSANIGNFHLSGAYGGVCLHRMSNEAGGVSSVFNCGHIPKRELFERINAYIDGVQFKS